MQTNKCKKSNHISTLKIHIAIIRAISRAVGYSGTLLGPKECQLHAFAFRTLVTLLFPALPACTSISCQSKFHRKLLFSLPLLASPKVHKVWCAFRRGRCETNLWLKANYVDKWKCHNDDNLFCLCQLLQSRQLVNIPLRHSRFHLKRRYIWQLSSACCQLWPKYPRQSAQLKVSNVFAIVESGRCRTQKPECPYRLLNSGKSAIERYQETEHLH